MCSQKLDARSPPPPGSAVCVIRNGQVSDLQYRGRTCHNGAGIDGETIWEAASLSKPVVANYALGLAVEGLLDLDEPLDVDLAALHAAADPRWDEVTARRVLTHTSGLPNWRGPLEANRAAGMNIDAPGEMLAFKRAPGSFGYSGEGYEVLLNALCRKVSRQPANLLDEALVLVGMRNSSFVWQPSFAATAANPHSANVQALTKQYPQQPRAAGSLHTTLSDYVAFALAVLEESADEIFEPSVLLDQTRGRSLGWRTVRTPAGPLAWQHGDNRGFKHLVGLRRSEGDGVVIFTNGDNGRGLCREIFARVLGARPW